ncbi:ATP-binding protein [Agathobacter rectalis]|jgi:SpoVK/Ycf46/Vps4 family AAA+-type ATPase|uniref:ATP-binding protein n=1 Tax=Agathobacter rectalis TaxID=39491 RepID=UPI0027D2DA0D|nr:ATP-binding protein [Agathobacter rectalis]
MRHKERIDVKNIKEKEIVKVVSIGQKDVRFRLQNAYVGQVGENTELLDETLVDNMLELMAKAVKTNYSKYNPVPNEIIIRNTMSEKKEDKPADNKESQDMIESYEPRFALEQVALNEKVKEQIQTAIAAVRYKTKMTEEWGMSEYFSGNRAVILNFYGKAGTGKSMTAEAVAKALNKKVYHINYSELESKYVGETPKNIRRAFECATRDDAVLIFDEADSFLGKRLSSVTQSADYGVNITRSVLLMELEKFSGVVVFTTNLISNYDEAFKRRILLSVYFDMPDEKARLQIWKLHLSDKMPLADDVTAESLAGRYDKVSGADIKDMVFYAALYTLEKEKECMDFSVFDYAYVTIQGRYQNKEEQDVQINSDKLITEEQYRKEIEKVEE